MKTKFTLLTLFFSLRLLGAQTTGTANLITSNFTAQGTINGNGAGITNLQHWLVQVNGTSTSTSAASISANQWSAPPMNGVAGVRGRDIWPTIHNIVITNLVVTIYTVTTALGVGTNLPVTLGTNTFGSVPVNSALTVTYNGTGSTGTFQVSDTTHSATLANPGGVVDIAFSPNQTTVPIVVTYSFDYYYLQ